MKFQFILGMLALIAGPVLAVNPEEMLDDPALEARARAISADVRCVVCQGENIDDSNAEIARQMRLWIREGLVMGKSDQEIIETLAHNYGDKVLMEPRKTGKGLILWLFAPVLFVLGFAGALRTVLRGQKNLS